MQNKTWYSAPFTGLLAVRLKPLPTRRRRTHQSDEFHVCIHSRPRLQYKSHPPEPRDSRCLPSKPTTAISTARGLRAAISCAPASLALAALVCRGSWSTKPARQRLERLTS